MGGWNFDFRLYWKSGEREGSFALVTRHFPEKLRDWSKAFKIVALDVLQPYVMEAFGTEGRSQIAKGWAELAPSTIAKRHSAHPILQVTGALKDSWRAGGVDHVQEIEPLRMRWGSRDPKALFMQFGTRRRVAFRPSMPRRVVFETKEARNAFHAHRLHAGPGGSPARPMLVWTRQLANEVTDKMRGYAMLVAQRAGFGIARGVYGNEPVSPVEARKLGEKMLRGQ